MSNLSTRHLSVRHLPVVGVRRAVRIPAAEVDALVVGPQKSRRRVS